MRIVCWKILQLNYLDCLELADMVELNAPFFVGVQITGRCNLSCRYCYAARLPRIDLPLMEGERLFREMKENDVFQIIIEGGEPFLHPNLRE
ncbi:hypothetical protein LCGC14_1916750, partial [marine sediment metagenome]